LRQVATYPYCAADGHLLFEVVRFDPKGFAQRRAAPANWQNCPHRPTCEFAEKHCRGGHIWSLQQTPCSPTVGRVLFRLPELLADRLAKPDEPVYVCSGERDANNLRKSGLTATTNPEGEGKGKWLSSFNEPLRGARCIILEDNDDTGRAHVLEVAASLHGIAASVKILRLPGLGDAGDVTDWLEAGHTIDELLALAAACPDWKLPVPPLGVVRTLGASNWPVFSPEALYGLAGDIVRALDPFTEADPVAILTNTLVGFGNLIGDGAHCRVGFTKHPPRLNAVQVGETAKGRKGTGWAMTSEPLIIVDSSWKERIMHGLSSGEGLIFQVRDQRIESQPVKQRGRVVDYEEVIVDQGVEDKRLLIVEQEFSQALKMMSREGNILSPTIRLAWDSGDLHPLTKTNPIRATGAHVSIIGHITRDELLRHLTETEMANGFGNRFLWLMVRRSKLLPTPKQIPADILSPLIERLKAAYQFALDVGELGRDAEAESAWCAAYAALSEGKPGMLGALTARAEAQVLRLSLIYTLLDCSHTIRLPHLQAALALWSYCERSAALIFGDSLGDEKADRILRTVRERGRLTETEIRDLFSRHDSKGVDRALGVLHRQGLLRPVTEESGGRPRIVWEPVSRES